MLKITINVFVFFIFCLLFFPFTAFIFFSVYFYSYDIKPKTLNLKFKKINEGKGMKIAVCYDTVVKDSCRRHLSLALLPPSVVICTPGHPSRFTTYCRYFKTIFGRRIRNDFRYSITLKLLQPCFLLGPPLLRDSGLGSVVRCAWWPEFRFAGC